MPNAPVAFLFDVDNTLLDNDAVEADLYVYLEGALGPERAGRYRQIFDGVRLQRQYTHYLDPLLRYHEQYVEEPIVADVSRFLLAYPFEERLLPGALQSIAHVRQWGPAALITDGDPVIQPRKIDAAGLTEAVGGNVFMYVNKERRLADLERRLPAEHYVLFDDKPRINAAAKRWWGGRVTTVQIDQGRFAEDLEMRRACGPADITLARIADVLRLDLDALMCRDR